MTRLQEIGRPVAELCPRCGACLVQPKRLPPAEGYLERRWCVKCQLWVERGQAPKDDSDRQTCALAGADVSHLPKRRTR